ncbi:DNA-directed RNA polymerase I subunit rpa1, partial [Diplonema papillatum]
MRCVGCSAEVKRESITTDPHPACPGHYCHVRLPRDMWVVNPLQWGDVIAMLRGSCWWCYRWKASLFDVRRKVASLRLLNARLWTPELEGYLDRTFSSSIMAKTTAPQRKAGRKKRKIAGKPPLDTAEEGEDEELHAESAPVKNTDEQGDEMMDWVASFLQEAEATVPVAERAPVGSFFAQRRKVVNDVWKLIAGVPASAPCRHCGLKTPKKITDYKKTALFYDIPGKDMDANIAAAAGRKGACGPKATWTSVRVALAEFKAETEINKGGGQVVHQKKVGRAGGKGKSLREAAPRSNVYLPPHRIQAQLEGLFFCEQESLGEVFYQVCSAPDSVDPELSVPAKDYWKAFVHRVVEVGPNKFRPFREGDGAVQADDQTKQISNLLACARNMVTIGSRFVGRSSKQSRTRPGKTARPVVAFWKARPRTFEFCARAAQDSYRRIMFSGASADAKPGKGTQQIFEKKSGLFRTNLMGKRVNQACRSVISPDNNLEDNQVLLSRRFAKRLTIPEVLPSPARIAALQEQAAAQPYLQGQVTVLKARRGFLQHSILNGASVYPGATRVEMDADDAAQIPFAYSLLLKARRPKFVSKTLTIDDVQLIDVSRATGKKALELVLWMERVLGDAVKTGAAKMGPGLDGVRFKVFRHVATDDWVILNRQPTLHKSSWLGQRLVVASNQRTIRFHYANCKGFNADFDGDEMNVHVPQTERAQVELRVLNSATQHFVSSTSGKPVFRHVATDDWVILNRQPTLHKSSWLGQRLVVASNQRTIRFHYANCKGFNADFDGDEMNVHVPQTERAQVELRVLNSATQHFVSSTSGKPVFRHVATDDWVILNRQPTLHKSSWLGQRLVVASNQRTIRFHYANCKGFNADFDGDEMNVHVPQTERAQVELRVLNSARQHFVSSTSGKPVRGLIQDHVVSGVLATMRDTFLSGGQFDRLIHHCLHKLGAPMPPRPEPAVRVRHRNKTGPGHHWVEAWTGKQLVSTVLGFVTANYSQVGRYSGGVCFEGRSALPASVWDDRPAAERPDFAADKFMEDDQVEVIFDTMVRGVVDKNQLGATSGTLVEHVHEVHGAEAAGTLICIFGRLFTEYLSHHGFTVGITDLMLKNDNETARSRLLRSLDASIVGKATEADRLGTVMKKTGELNKAMFPSGMAKQLPQNCLALMTMSGAKGSGVNATQMAVLLGQQTFDGHRVQCMPSGKTLPGTLLGDDRASCGGFGLAISRLLRSLDASIVGKATEADRLGTVMKKTGELNKAMFPSGMAKQLPQNCLALMTMSGVKGSGVNATQMAVLLGQQTFDGHRVQCMPSGKTLPGTLLGDDRASCGGFGL